MNPNEGRKPEQFDNCLRYWVWSRTRRGQKYLVELSAYDFNGACSCPHFQTRLEPLLRRAVTPAQASHEKLIRLKEGQRPSDILRCAHIIDAFMQFAEDVGRVIQKTHQPAKK